MVELLRWLRARLRADRSLALAAIFVLGVDLLLIWLHVQRFVLRRMGLVDHVLAADRLGLDDNTGLNALWLVAQVTMIAAASAVVAARSPSFATILASLLALGIAAAKIAKPHLVLGELLARELSLHGWLGLNGRQLGKLVAEIGLGLAWLAVASVSARLARDGAGRTAAALCLWLVVALAVAGGLSDLGYMVFAHHFKGAVALFALVEGGGEMLVLTVGMLGFLALARGLGRYRGPKGATPNGLTRPSLPDAPSRCYTEPPPVEVGR